MRRNGAANSFGGAEDFAFHYLYAPEFSPNLTSASPPKLNSAIQDKLDRARADWVILSLGGNEHNILSIVQLYEKYDFILGEQPELSLTPGAEIYPEAMARETLRERMAETLDLLLAFRSASPAPMAQVAPPPPLPKAHVLAHPRELLPNPIYRNRISPDSLRFKMWRVACGLYRDICQKAGIFFVETPSGVVDEDGMLTKCYQGADATHANEAFGQRMMEEAFRHFTDLSGR